MLLSVIVPVYNCENYIQDCIESILNQTYKNIELIIINDGSTDGTENVLKQYENNEKIKIIHQVNKGVSSARNCGIDIANGEFITFVDSDDTIDIDMYELLMRYFLTEEYDIVHCGYKRVNGKDIKQIKGTGNIIVQNSYEALECLISGNLFVGSPCNKIYRKKLFENIRFNEDIKINEDILLNYQVFKNSNKSIFIDKCKYNYITRKSSSCSTTNNIKKSEDCMVVAEYIYNDCKNTILEKRAKNKYFKSLISLYRSYYYGKDKRYKKVKEDIRKFYKSNIIERKNDKISAVLIIYFSYLYGIFYKIYDKIRVPNWDL